MSSVSAQVSNIESLEAYANAYGCSVEEFSEWADNAFSSYGAGTVNMSIAELIADKQNDTNLNPSDWIGTVDAYDPENPNPFTPEGSRKMSAALTVKLSTFMKEGSKASLQTKKDVVILRKGYKMAVLIKGVDDGRISKLKSNGCYVCRTVLYRQERGKW